MSSSHAIQGLLRWSMCEKAPPSVYSLLFVDSPIPPAGTGGPPLIVSKKSREKNHTGLRQLAAQHRADGVSNTQCNLFGERPSASHSPEIRATAQEEWECVCACARTRMFPFPLNWNVGMGEGCRGVWGGGSELRGLSHSTRSSVSMPRPQQGVRADSADLCPAVTPRRSARNIRAPEMIS